MNIQDLTNEQQKSLALFAVMTSHHKNYTFFSIQTHTSMSLRDMSLFTCMTRVGNKIKYTMLPELSDIASVLVDMLRLENPSFGLSLLNTLKGLKKSSL